MKNLLFFLIVSFVFCSFSPSLDDVSAIGEYGVRSYDGGNAMIKLSILEDHTFHYYNVSDPNNKVDVEGKWSLENNKIILSDYDEQVSIHTKWKIEDDCKCIKSRKGLYFMRICEIEYEVYNVRNR